MKVVSINGSPRGRASNTAVMLGALLKGLRSPDTEIHEILLSERDIRYCRGCYCCWTSTPGRCVIDDDMAGILALLPGTDLYLLGSPVYFGNVSGTLKVFVDRLTAAGGNPREASATQGQPERPQFVLVSNCGMPDRSQFEVVSAWMKRFASMMGGILIGEFYTTNGKVLTQATEDQTEPRRRYLEYLEDCGRRYRDGMSLDKESLEGMSLGVLDI